MTETEGKYIGYIYTNLPSHFILIKYFTILFTATYRPSLMNCQLNSIANMEKIVGPPLHNPWQKTWEQEEIFGNLNWMRQCPLPLWQYGWLGVLAFFKYQFVLIGLTCKEGSFFPILSFKAWTPDCGRLPRQPWTVLLCCPLVPITPLCRPSARRDAGDNGPPICCVDKASLTFRAFCSNTHTQSSAGHHIPHGLALEDAGKTCLQECSINRKANSTASHKSPL